MFYGLCSVLWEVFRTAPGAVARPLEEFLNLGLRNVAPDRGALRFKLISLPSPDLPSFG